MNFTDVFIRRPVLATVVSLLILIFGIRALFELPLRQFPKMSNTVITITTAYPGASAELMQGFVTSIIQKAIASADGIDYITAQSSEGVSTIKANIRLNFNPNQAMTEIMSKVAQVTNNLPKESDQPVIQKDTGNSMALMYIGFNSQDMTNQQITDYLARVVQPKLQTVDGVASADILGGQTYAMRIWLNSEKMAALNITTTDVVNALQAENFQTAAGQVKGKYVLFNVNVRTNLDAKEGFEDITIKNKNDSLVKLSDIATIELGAENYDSSVIFNGKNAVFIGIQSTPSANPLTTITNVKKILPSLEANYPKGFDGKIVYDSTDYIRSSIHEVIRSITEASFIVILVIFFFLGSIRTVTIPIITIPLSLIGVASLMLFMGYSLNLLTLLAMVLAIGLVVDDSIVVLENIYRHIETGLTPFEAALKGAREIASPIIAMTTTLAAVYAPIGFMSGLTGSLFKEFAFTLALTVVISGIVALTLSPMMCSLLLNHSVSDNKLVHKIDAFFEKFKEGYEEKLQLVLHNRNVVLVFAGIILTSCFLLAATTTTELAPEEDQSVLFLSLTAPEYANINYTTKFTSELNDIFKKIPETEDYFVVNGAGSVTNAFAGLILKPWNERSRSQQSIQNKLQMDLSKIAGLNAVGFGLPSIPGAGDGLPVQFVVTTTSDYTALNEVVQKLQAAAMKSGMFLFMDSDLKFDRPELMVNIDRDKAGLMGVSMQSIGTALATYMGGGNINRFARDGQSYEVIPQISDDLRLNPDKINNMYVPNASNQLIPLSTLIHLNVETKPDSLNQFQQLNSATLQGLPMPGKSLNEALSYLQKQAAKIMPEGFSIDYAGESRQATSEGSSMVYTFLFAVLLIYLVLCAQFESFRDPLIILVSVPLSLAGALVFLNVGFATLNIYTGIGLITLIGLISKHGILMVQFANALQQHEGLSVTSAIIKSAALRLRPILMTTAAMILGVVPLIFASGAGSKSRYDIGLVIAMGMLIGTCFTLFVVPTMYTYLAKKHAN